MISISIASWRQTNYLVLITKPLKQLLDHSYYPLFFVSLILPHSLSLSLSILSSCCLPSRTFQSRLETGRRNLFPLLRIIFSQHHSVFLLTLRRDVRLLCNGRKFVSIPVFWSNEHIYSIMSDSLVITWNIFILYVPISRLYDVWNNEIRRHILQKCSKLFYTWLLVHVTINKHPFSKLPLSD